MTDDITLVTMPKWGLAMQEGTLADWLVKEGAEVARGAPLCDIETAKIANEMEAPADGLLRRIVRRAGDRVEVGQVIAVIASADVSDDAIDVRLAEGAGADTSDAESDAESLRTGAGGVAYLQTGPDDADTALVLIHGFGGDHLNWSLLQGSLPTALRVVAIDLPGHGASTREVGDGSAPALAERVGALIEELGIRHLHLAAHSFGARVALALAEDREIETLTLIAPLAFSAAADPGYVEGFLGAKRKRDMAPVMEMLFSDPGMVGRTMVTDALRQLRDGETRDAMTSIGKSVLARSGDAEAEAAILSRRPALIVWGDADRVVPMPAGLSSRLPGARIAPIAGAGHMPHAETPDVVAGFLRDLIEGEGDG